MSYRSKSEFICKQGHEWLYLFWASNKIKHIWIILVLWEIAMNIFWKIYTLSPWSESIGKAHREAQKTSKKTWYFEERHRRESQILPLVFLFPFLILICSRSYWSSLICSRYQNSVQTTYSHIDSTYREGEWVKAHLPLSHADQVPVITLLPMLSMAAFQTLLFMGRGHVYQPSCIFSMHLHHAVDLAIAEAGDGDGASIPVWWVNK